MEIRVTTQQELDEALARPDLTYSDDEIIIDSPRGVWLEMTDSKGLSVLARGSSTVLARNSSILWAYDSSTVQSYDSVNVHACGSSTVDARDLSTVDARDLSSVWAYGSSTVQAHGSSTVRAYDSSRVWAFNLAGVWAGDSSTVQAFDSVNVRACDLSSVRACGSSIVRAYGSATVRAYGLSTVRAGRYVAVHLYSKDATITGGVLIDMTHIDSSDPATWCDLTGVEVDADGLAHLYKAVDNDLYAGHSHVKTQYLIGGDPECDSWRDDNECGGGLHVCPTPGAAFDHYEQATRFLEVTVPLDSIRLIDTTKAKARTVHVLREVDLHGRPVEV